MTIAATPSVNGKGPSQVRSARSAIDALDACLETYRRWLHLPDPGVVYVTLGAVAANLAPADPVWLLLVGPPSAGKTETLSPLAHLAYAHPAGTLTEASLLSGTPKKDRADGARGGLLREIGDFGVLVLKDFTSVLAQNRDTRAQVLAALREVYDGSWTRHVGTDGGRMLHWEGKVGVIAGCTPTYDQHSSVIGAMGDRFVVFRLPPVDRDAIASGALAHAGREIAMRQELAGAVSQVLGAIDRGCPLRAIDKHEEARLSSLAVFATTCRTAVERDSRTREVLAVPEPEGPARFVGQLRLLLHGLEAIGVPDPWKLLAKLALDAMVGGRLAVLLELRTSQLPRTTADVAAATQLPSVTARRHLEDLALLGVVVRTKASGASNAVDLWAVTRWTADHWPRVGVPESQDGESGVPESPDPLSNYFARKKES